MPHAREPDASDLMVILQAEAKRDAPILARGLFSKGGPDVEQVSRPAFIAQVKEAWQNGAPQPDGSVMPAPVWRAQLLQRYGPERFWQILYDAGLTTVKDPVAAIKPTQLSGPKLFEEALHQAIDQAKLEDEQRHPQQQLPIPQPGGQPWQ